MIKSMSAATAVAALLFLAACAPPTPPESEWIAVGACYATYNALTGEYSTLEYLGPVGVAGNFRGGPTTTGDCADLEVGPDSSVAIVRAPSPTVARQECRARGFSAALTIEMRMLWDEMPGDAHGCYPRLNGPLSATLSVTGPGILDGWRVGEPMDISAGTAGVEPELVTSCRVTINGVEMPQLSDIVDPVTGDLDCGRTRDHRVTEPGVYVVVVVASTATETATESVSVTVLP
jgi:hypothetical protein